MIRPLVLLLAALFIAGPVAAEPPRRALALSYTISFVAGPDAPHVAVDLVFDGNASGSTSIELPSAWGGQEGLTAAVRKLEVLTPNARLSETSLPYVKVVAHGPRERVHVRYELWQDREHPLEPGSGAGYRVVVQPTYVHLLGHNALVHPAWSESTRVRVSLEWRDLPKDWSIANSFGVDRRKQTFTAMLGNVTHAVYVAGDFRIVNSEVYGKPIHVAVRGTWMFTDAELADLARRIFEVERGFWNDRDIPYYLITLTQVDDKPGAYSRGGTGLTDSFALFVTPNVELKDLRYLLAHELFHDWNSQKLGRMPDPEQSLYWFSEGFTDFYTYALLKRSGLITADEYLAQYNELLRSLEFSPARGADNDRIVREFWTNYDVQKLPYWRGALLATKWDADIRAATSGRASLDDVMRELGARAKGGSGVALDPRAIGEAVGRHLGRDVGDDLERYVVRGEMVGPELLGPCFEPTSLEIHDWELGLDLEALKKKTIAGVVAGSAAYEAGLRDGQTVVRRKPVYLNDATKEVEITIQDGASERTITYMPAARTGRTIPQVRFRDGAECVK